MISVIVPVYNTAQYLDECIQSLISQTYTDLEILMIDDCSTDHSLDTLNQWAARDPRIRVIRKEANSGVSSSRNIGLALAQGDYIGFVDSDDWIDPNMYQKLYDCLDKSGADIAICGVKMVYEDRMEQLIPSVSSGVAVSKAESVSECLTQIGSGRANNMYIWDKLFHRSTLLQEDGSLLKFNEAYHFCEDVLWVLQAFCCCEKFVFCQESLYYYRKLRLGSSVDLLKKGTTDPILVYRQVYDLLQSNHLPSARAVYQRMLSYEKDFLKAAAKTGEKNPILSGHVHRLLHYLGTAKKRVEIEWVLIKLLQAIYYQACISVKHLFR